MSDAHESAPPPTGEVQTHVAVTQRTPTSDQAHQNQVPQAANPQPGLGRVYAADEAVSQAAAQARPRRRRGGPPPQVQAAQSQMIRTTPARSALTRTGPAQVAQPQQPGLQQPGSQQPAPMQQQQRTQQPVSQQPGSQQAAAHQPVAQQRRPGLIQDDPRAGYPVGQQANQSAAAGQHLPGQPGMGAEELVQEVIGRIDEARPMPLSGSVMVNREEVLALLDEALAALPGELQQARWLLRERDEVLQRAATDASLLIEEARSRVAQMVQRTEVVRSAERRARQLIDDAQSQARTRRHEIDDYCTRVLGKFEHDLVQILERVQLARRKLEAPIETHPADGTHPDVAAQAQAHLAQSAPEHLAHDAQATQQHTQPMPAHIPAGAGTHAAGADFAPAPLTRQMLFDQEKV